MTLLLKILLIEHIKIQMKNNSIILTTFVEQSVVYNYVLLMKMMLIGFQMQKI